MKIAIISDIHGNHHAMEAVLKEAKSERIEKILVLGDIVGYYYCPEKIFQQLSEWSYLIIQGNHERLLVNLISGKISEVEITKKYGSGHRFAIEKLSQIQLNKLATAPVRLFLEEDNVKMLMCHGSPWDPDLYIYPDSSENILDRCDDPNIDFIFIGHSHYKFIRKNLHSVLVNVGSVGQSRLKGGMADWAIVDTSNKRVELRATSYDVKLLISEIIDSDPSYLKEILLR